MAYFLPILRTILLLFFLFSGMTLSAQIIIEQPPKPSGVVISGVTLICKGSETQLKVEGDYESFLWSNGSTERIVKVKDEGIYEVTVKTKGGCSLTSSVNVQTRECN